MLNFLGFGEKLNYFKDLGGGGGQRQNTFMEPRKLFSVIWGINALFSGIKGAQIPLGPHLFCKRL